jgi:Holliday junction DNA helicase RuvA
MINHIEGRLTEKTPTYAVIDCAGVGYLLHISLNTFTKIGSSEKCRLYAHLAIREDAHTLYGFADQEERLIFRHLISVSGVGASTARMILSSLSPAEVTGAIMTGNVPALKGIKGIGEKSAQRIIVDLKGKLGKDNMPSEFFTSTNNTAREEALSALVMLGFAKNVAEKALEKVMKTEEEGASVEQLIKQALKNL